MASFWEEFKDLFKTDSQREEERQNALNAALDAEKAVTEQLAALDREYRESLPAEPEIDIDKLFPEDPGFEKIEYTPATDEELVNRAQAGVDYEKAEEKRDLTNAFGNAAQELEDRADRAEKDLNASYRELGELYDELRRQTDNDALRRGVARSSIRTSAQQDLTSDRTRAEQESKAAYDSTMSGISAELAALQQEQEAAFEELDLKYAAELEERIADLKAQRDETAKKYADYNNKITEAEREYALEREENIADYLAEREKERLEREEQTRQEEAAHGYTGAKQENYAKRYNIAFDFYTSLSPDIAADALAASPSMKYYLGNYYDKLMSALTGDTGQQRYY